MNPRDRHFTYGGAICETATETDETILVPLRELDHAATAETRKRVHGDKMAMTALILDQHSRLLGNVPATLESWNIDGSDRYEELHIVGHNDVEVIYVPSEEGYFCTHVVIENLPNLRELHVGANVIWLRCSNLPSLQKLEIDADLKWIVLDSLAALEQLDLSSCTALDVLNLQSLPALQDVNVDGCVKLRCVEEISTADQMRLGIPGQIARNQSKSRNSLEVYDNMTFSDIDRVRATIDAAGIELFQRGLLDADSDSIPKHLIIRLLNPLEDVYTGGTGERYSYECAIEFEPGDVGNCIGEHSPEDCLRNALRRMRAGCRDPKLAKGTEQNMLEYLGRLLEDRI